MAYRRHLVLTCLLALAAFGSSEARAQPWAGRGSLSGQVLDPAGQPVPGATVRLRWVEVKYAGNTDVEAHRVTAEGPAPVETDAQGRWRLVGLRRGVWSVAVLAKGFAPNEQKARSLVNAPAGGGPAVLVSRLEPAPPAPQPALLEAAALLASGRTAEARAKYLEALPALDAKGQAEVHLAVARTYYLEGDKAQAIAEVERALALDPELAGAVTLLVALKKEAGPQD